MSSEYMDEMLHRSIEVNPDFVLAYHGTDSDIDFSSFEITEDLGFHFGSSYAANKRLLDISEGDPDAIEYMRVIPCILHVKNPLRLRDCFTWDTQNVLRGLLDQSVLSEEEYMELSNGGYLDREMLQEILNRKGFDSVVYENLTEHGGDSYMVLDSKLIEFKLSSEIKHSKRLRPS